MRPAAAAFAVGALGAVGALLLPARARAEDAPRSPAAEEAVLRDRLRLLRREPGGTAELHASLGVGKGLRFNNPYRLSTQLGDDAASASLTATYLDVGIGAAFGEAEGLHHGAALHLGGAIEGVSQAFLVPTYLVTLRVDPRVMLEGRLGPSVLLSPDPNVGGEVAVGATWFATAGLGVGADLLFDAFYGAATLDTTAALHPILSAQLELVLVYEVIP